MSDDSRVFEIDVTREHVIAAEASFRSILLARGRDAQTRFNAVPLLNRRFAFGVLQALAPIGLLASFALVWVLLVGGASPPRIVGWGVVGVLFGALTAFVWLVGWKRSERILDDWLARVADRAARKIVRKTLTIAPFRVTYSVRADTWRTVVREPALEVTFRRGELLDVRTNGQVVCLYRRSRSFRWSAVVWAVTPEVRAAIDEFTGVTADEPAAP